MADANSYDYNHSLHKPFTTKPTNLDEEIHGVKEPTSLVLTHEDATPEDLSGARDSSPIEEQLIGEPKISDTSASEITMSFLNQKEATFVSQDTLPIVNGERNEESNGASETEETKEEAETETKSESKSETNTNTESEPKTEVESKIETESASTATAVESKTETESETKTKTESESKTETESQSKTEVESKIETESVSTATAVESKTETESESKTETESQSKTETESQSKTEVESKTETESETKTETSKTESNTLNGEPLNDHDSGISLSNSSSKPRVPHDWIDVLGNGNLLKRVLREGEGVSTRPMALSQIRMKVRGSLQSGGVVDRHSALEFTVGDGDVIQALDIVAPLMEKGETCQIKTDHRYAFGAVGRNPDIPPQSTLLYDLELINVKGPLDYSTVTEQEFLHHLNKKRGRGNDLFQRKEFSLAVHSYSRAVSMMSRFKEEQSLPEFSPEIADLWVRCLNNLAAAQLKVEMYNEALDSVNKVLETDPENVKALYRCGKVYMVKCDYEEAVKYLQRASDIDPEERAINGELQRAIRKRDQGREQEKAMYKRMMTGGGGNGGVSSRHTSPNPSGAGGGASSSNSWNWKYIVLGAGIAALAAVGIGYLGFKYRK